MRELKKRPRAGRSQLKSSQANLGARGPCPSVCLGQLVMLRQDQQEKRVWPSTERSCASTANLKPAHAGHLAQVDACPVTVILWKENAKWRKKAGTTLGVAPPCSSDFLIHRSRNISA